MNRLEKLKGDAFSFPFKGYCTNNVLHNKWLNVWIPDSCHGPLRVDAVTRENSFLRYRYQNQLLWESCDAALPCTVADTTQAPVNSKIMPSLWTLKTMSEVNLASVGAVASERESGVGWGWYFWMNGRRRLSGRGLRSELLSCFVLEFMWRDCEILTAARVFTYGESLLAFKNWIKLSGKN